MCFTCGLGRISQRSRNFSGPFRVPQFPSYLDNAEASIITILLVFLTLKLSSKFNFSKQAGKFSGLSRNKPLASFDEWKAPQDYGSSTLLRNLFPAICAGANYYSSPVLLQSESHHITYYFMFCRTFKKAYREEVWIQ